jgi:hypothetical protein
MKSDEEWERWLKLVIEKMDWYWYIIKNKGWGRDTRGERERQERKRQKDRERDRETERQRDRETERQRAASWFCSQIKPHLVKICHISSYLWYDGSYTI